MIMELKIVSLSLRCLLVGLDNLLWMAIECKSNKEKPSPPVDLQLINYIQV